MYVEINKIDSFFSEPTGFIWDSNDNQFSNSEWLIFSSALLRSEKYQPP